MSEQGAPVLQAYRLYKGFAEGPLFDVPFWNEVMEAGPAVWADLRTKVTALLAEGAQARTAVEPHLVPRAQAMALWAMREKIPLVCVGAAGGKRLAHQVDVDDLAHVTHDPLLAQLRYQLRKHHGAPKQGKRIGVRCVFSREAVTGPDASCAIEGDGSLNCHGYGSLVGVTATFGMCAATEVINLLSAQTSARKMTL